MINYNPKDWIPFIFKLHKSDTFRKLIPAMLAMAIYAFGVAYLEIYYLQLSENHHLKNINIVHSLLGFVISMLLVFRTNTAYDRWWEGRKLWGSLTNTSRNLALKISAILHDEHDRNYFRTLIPLYASVLAKHLTNEEVGQTLYDDIQLEINQHKHKPNQVARALHQKVNDLLKAKKITDFEYLSLQTELQAFTDIMGGCERIKNTPIPYSYSVFIKKFIFLYVITLPIGLVFTLGFYAIPVVVFMFYILASLELIAEEIEEPFGGDENDLPIQKMAANIKIHVQEVL